MNVSNVSTSSIVLASQRVLDVLSLRKGRVRMSELKITQCKGEGQGSCKRCTDNGKWNRNWMCFLYKIEGKEGCYCFDCVKEIKAGVQHDLLH